MNKCTILSVMNRHNFGKFFFPFLFILFIYFFFCFILSFVSYENEKVYYSFCQEQASLDKFCFLSLSFFFFFGFIFPY